LLPNADVEAVLEIFETLGPTPRLCIELASEPERLQVYKDQLNRVISGIIAADLEKLANDVSRLTMDTVSHKICLIRRRDRNNVRSGPVVSPITDSIKSQLLNQLRNLQQAEPSFLTIGQGAGRERDSRHCL
jgi:hypothetical protein